MIEESTFFSAKGFEKYLLDNMTEGSAKSYMSYIASQKDPIKWPFLKGGQDLLSYICQALNCQAEHYDLLDLQAFAVNLIDSILEILEDLLDKHGRSDKNLQNLRSALRKFKMYVYDRIKMEEFWDGVEDLFDAHDDIEDGSQPNSNSSPDITWFEVHKPYNHPFIYKSAKKSIFRNFETRIFSQDRPGGTTITFPVKLIRSIFVNAANLAQSGSLNHCSPSQLADTILLASKIGNIVETILNRILFYTVDESESNKSNGYTRIPDKMWPYPLAAVKELGWRRATGEIFIKLRDAQATVKQVYSFNPTTSKWEPIVNVSALSQLHLDHDARMQTILSHIKDNILWIKQLNSMNIDRKNINSKNYNQNSKLWAQLIPMLPGLYRDFNEVMSNCNIDVMLASHNRSKH